MSGLAQDVLPGSTAGLAVAAGRAPEGTAPSYDEVQALRGEGGGRRQTSRPE
ncbi:hypothetical protein ABZV31_05685 [Streptomyces sp. NPDC005202]|uniref:hypothetical protein n=1 Tax=Streptomyces sp. NPDC005202 TaxID=3157021 RepID=UPI0033B31D70